MKVKAIKPFADYEAYKMYEVGEVIDLPDNRATLAIDKGLAIEMVEKAEKKPTSRKRSKKED